MDVGLFSDDDRDDWLQLRSVWNFRCLHKILCSRDRYRFQNLRFLVSFLSQITQNLRNYQKISKIQQGIICIKKYPSFYISLKTLKIADASVYLTVTLLSTIYVLRNLLEFSRIYLRKTRSHDLRVSHSISYLLFSRLELHDPLTLDSTPFRISSKLRGRNMGDGNAERRFQGQKIASHGFYLLRPRDNCAMSQSQVLPALQIQGFAGTRYQML